jgi:hypothetical protein
MLGGSGMAAGAAGQQAAAPTHPASQRKRE